MVEEEVVALSPPAPLDHQKRKLADLELEATQPADEPVPPSSKGEEEDHVMVSESEDASQTKRLRVDGSHSDALAAENGHQHESEDAAEEDYSQKGAEALGEEQNLAEETSIKGNVDSPVQQNAQKVDSQPDHAQISSLKIEQLENAVKPSADESQPAAEMPQQDVTEQTLAESGNQTSRRMEVPNNMVGVLIGKAGDTIRNLQFNSGAKIQITRDADADPGSATRSVELIGTLDGISKAEKLIKEVIAEADAGGSPSLVARGFSLAAGAMEQVEIQVPNEKVGLIIGRGGETIKNLQTRSGARIQLIPQHLPDGDKSKERTVRVSGDKKQIDIARQLIKDVMNQNVKPSTLLSNYGQQQSYRPRGPPGAAPQWGPHGPHPSMPYDYQQHRGGPYPSQNQPYPPYGGYPPQGPPRGSFGSGWEQRPPMQGPHNHSGGYDYYGGQGGGYAANVPPSAPHPAHMPLARPSGSSMGHNMPSHAQANYSYGQPPYSQTAPSHQGYTQSYAEPKYGSQAAAQQPYGGPHGPTSQPGTYQDAQGYPNQQQYPPPPYSVPSQGAPAQPYQGTQPGNMAYQAPVSAAPSYGQNMPAQQLYPYASGAMAASTTDGYSQPQAAAVSMPGYPQQGGSQPVAGYSQPGMQQQAQGYSQAYGQYAPAQQAYSNQTAAAASYGYQGQGVPSAYAAGQTYSGAPPTAGQTGYAQPATSHASYEQSVPQQAGGYPPAPAAAAVAAPAAATVVPAAATVAPAAAAAPPAGGYPQQYDASQMYGASG